VTPVLLRVAAWISLAAAAVLSLLPGDEMVRTGIDGRYEHLAFYAGVGAIVTAAYAPRLPVPALVAALIAYAGVLEVCQIFVPGRHSSVWDWGASSAGVVLGVILAATLMRRMARARP
jgi:peptidoglycan/LPS O-acetylase OafA/YrhL